MLRELDDMGMIWAHESENWSEAFQLGLDKLLCSSSEEVELVEKVDESKLAHDVDDLSAIFQGLADGVEYSLPPFIDAENECDEASQWIEGLEDDAANVDEIAQAFDILVAENAKNESMVDMIEMASASEYSSEEEEDEDMDVSDAEEENHSTSIRRGAISVQIIPSAPVWATFAPLDPRSCIRTPVFKNLDSRIPRIDIPRIDLAFANGGAHGSGVVVGATQQRSTTKEACVDGGCRHDPSTCWICKSSNSAYRKRALHRYTEKRSRRNWRKGPRYSGRSNVATARVRDGGRFMCSTQWI